MSHQNKEVSRLSCLPDKINVSFCSLPCPKVTIVTPSFNQGKYLEETIRSVLSQDYPNIEYIVIDGGSTDNSVEVIRKYESQLAYWISEKDLGQADAINKGFRKSSGDFLGWINSDDVLYPSAVSSVMKVFSSYPNVDLVYGDVEQGRSTGIGAQPLLGQQMDFTEMLKTLQVPMPQQGSIWRRSVVDRVGSLDSRWHVVLDREFFTRVAENCKIFYLPGVLGFFRHHEQSKSISQQRSWLIELPKMYREFFVRSELPLGLRKLESRTMGMVFLTCGSIAQQCGETRLAAGYLAMALRVDPLIMFRSYVRSKIIKSLRKIAENIV
jgi:glycosyltransferase involved in cell wall biosynthesis